ncbi:MAG: class II fumarate hydratase [Desulfuromonadales bacterium]|nr:class II fumarate hydratase [Desulfuromonadales bacterium]
MNIYRTEQDSLGPMQVPDDALYGAQTARALANFPISGRPLSRPLLRALGLVKQYAARANRELGLLPGPIAGAIIAAAQEVVAGELDSHFPVDVFQTGSGTSSNMNMNEVIANRAAQLLGEQIGGKAVHPNDQVNLGQSSNDVFPTAIHIACVEQLHNHLLPSLKGMEVHLRLKAEEFADVLKIGRTHLQDATPVRLGQVFNGYARQLELARERLLAAAEGLSELALGGTAVGTGINTHPQFAELAIAGIAEETGMEFREAEDHFEAQGAKDGLVALSGALKGCAVSLFKVANDIRFLASGPRCGIGELRLPALQPGSSIMPGKVNPVLAESVMQVCAQVTGNDATVTLCGLSGNFELNVMMPVMAESLLQSIDLLGNVVDLFSERYLKELEADRDRCDELLDRSLALVTALVPAIGYDKSAELAKRAYAEGKTIRELLLAENLLPVSEVDRLLDPERMTEPTGD